MLQPVVRLLLVMVEVLVVLPVSSATAVLLDAIFFGLM
jgi:hypothetical protein